MIKELEDSTELFETVSVARLPFYESIHFYESCCRMSAKSGRRLNRVQASNLLDIKDHLINWWLDWTRPLGLESYEWIVAISYMDRCTQFYHIGSVDVSVSWLQPRTLPDCLLVIRSPKGTDLQEIFNWFDVLFRNDFERQWIFISSWWCGIR